MSDNSWDWFCPLKAAAALAQKQRLAAATTMGANPFSTGGGSADTDCKGLQGWKALNRLYNKVNGYCWIYLHTCTVCTWVGVSWFSFNHCRNCGIIFILIIIYSSILILILMITSILTLIILGGMIILILISFSFVIRIVILSLSLMMILILILVGTGLRPIFCDIYSSSCCLVMMTTVMNMMMAKKKKKKKKTREDDHTFDSNNNRHSFGFLNALAPGRFSRVALSRCPLHEDCLACLIVDWPT